MLDLSSLHSNQLPDDAVGSDLDASLIDRLKRQDPTAFQDLINLYGDPIRNLIGRLMAFAPEMEDVFQIPYRDREILVLVYLQGHSVQELALAMNEKTNTLEVRLHRAKKLLKQTIEKEIAIS